MKHSKSLEVLLNKFKKLKLTKYKKEKYVLVFCRHHVNNTIRQCILAKHFNTLRRTKTIAVCDIKNDASDFIYQKLNFDKIFYTKDLFSILNIFSNIKIILEFVPEIIKLLISKNYLNSFIKKFKFNEIFYGDIIYDTYIRHGHIYRELNRLKYIYGFLKIYFTMRLKINLINSINNRYIVDKVIISSKGFVVTGNLALRIFSRMSKKPIFLADRVFKIYKKNDYLHSYHKVFKKDLSQLPINKFKKKINKYFNDKYKKLIISDQSFVKKETLQESYRVQSSKKSVHSFFINKKKIAIIALNSFSDSPHYQGSLLFRDYYDWFERTINYIAKQKISNTHWIIKTHPAQQENNRMSYNEISIVDEVMSKNKFKNLEMMPANVNNRDLFRYASQCITCISTIGLEFACFGKRPILCGDANYTGLGFTYKVSSQEKYFSLLKNLPSNNLLNEQQIYEAKSTIFILDQIKQNNLKIKKSSIPYRYTQYQALNDNEYINLLNKNFNKNKKDITHDDYYKKLLHRAKRV
jgi:hypothetical protein